MDADILIVGAGIAGLRCGIRLLQQRPDRKVIILEKYKYVGGRVVTYLKQLDVGPRACRKVAWENGAGRIYKDHKLVHSLLKQYGLHTINLGTESLFRAVGESAVANHFEAYFQTMYPLLSGLSPNVLATHTLEEILLKILGPSQTKRLLAQFGYRAEITTLRADLGLAAFAKEMGTYDGYTVVQEGLGKLIDGMVREFTSLGGRIMNQQTVVDLQESNGVVYVKAKTEGGERTWSASQVILALHSAALNKIPVFHHWSLLRHLRMEPLLRVYAVFPTHKGRSWFSDMPRVITDLPLRYFIPIQAACGIAMISYTDGDDARRLMRILDKYGEKSLERFLLKELRRLFPEKNVPAPIFFKTHPWTYGCTYWLPGSYDPAEMSEKALHPFTRQMPGVFVCGESFSMRQAWMEGALEHADLLLKKYF